MEEEQDMHIASRGSLLVILALLLGIHIFAFRSKKGATGSRAS